MKLPVITNSELKEFRACSRSWSFRYGQLRRPRAGRAALKFGTLVHEGLEAWWLAFMLGAGLTPIKQAMSVIYDPEDDAPRDAFDLAKAEALLIGYHARWAAEPYDVLGVEVEFRAPLLNPETGAASKTFELGGKLDALIRIADGPHAGVWVVEHKTSSEDIRLGSTYWNRLRLDAQISTYMVGARSLGHDPRGVLYDVIGKPGLRPLQATKQRKVAETPDEYRERILADIAKDPDAYYQRGFVVRLEDEERDAAYDAWTTATLLRDAKRLGRFPRNADACMRFNTPCAYFDVCTGVASIDDNTRFRTAERAHEELSE